MSWIAHSHTHSLTLLYVLTLSLFISVIVWFIHYLVIHLSFFILCWSGQSDFNCNNIVNWGYCEWRSQTDQQPLFPAFASPHHSRKDTWFLNPQLTVSHFHCLLCSELRPCIKVLAFFFSQLDVLKKPTDALWLLENKNSHNILTMCMSLQGEGYYVR